MKTISLDRLNIRRRNGHFCLELPAEGVRYQIKSLTFLDPESAKSKSESSKGRIIPQVCLTVNKLKRLCINVLTGSFSTPEMMRIHIEESYSWVFNMVTLFSGGYKVSVDNEKNKYFDMIWLTSDQNFAPVEKLSEKEIEEYKRFITLTWPQLISIL